MQAASVAYMARPAGADELESFIVCARERSREVEGNRREALDKQARVDRVEDPDAWGAGTKGRPGNGKMQDSTFYGTKRMRLGTSRR